jgi:hypothetical protein
VSATPRTEAFLKSHHERWPNWDWDSHGFAYVEWAKKLERENAALRADKERLDWLLTPMGSTVCYGHLRDNFTLTRAAIDAARKEKL